MSFAEAIVAGLHELRGHAEALMRDTCVIERLGETATDPETGEVVTDVEQVYTGRCKVGGDRPYETDTEGGGHTSAVQRYTLHLPVTAGPVSAGDAVRILTAAEQPHLVGNEYRIAGMDERTLQTAQRVFIDT